MKINLILVLVLCFGATIFPGRKKLKDWQRFTPRECLQKAEALGAPNDYDDGYDADCESKLKDKFDKQKKGSTEKTNDIMLQ